MIKETITLKSGHVLTMTDAQWTVGARLFKAVATRVRAVDIDAGAKLDMGADLNLSTLDPKLFNVLKNIICELAMSDAIETVLFECFARCMIDGVKITKETFEPREARQDYIPAAWEVMIFNLRPFFQGLDLSSLVNASRTASPPK